MFGRALASVVLAAFALTGAHAAPSNALKLHGNRVFVSVTVNGVEAEALLDSAAEITSSIRGLRPGSN